MDNTGLTDLFYELLFYKLIEYLLGSTVWAYIIQYYKLDITLFFPYLLWSSRVYQMCTYSSVCGFLASKLLMVPLCCFQQTSNIIAQGKFNPARDPCSVMWDVTWDDLVTMEVTLGKKDRPNAPPSRVILYLRSRSDMKDQARTIKCNRESNQAFEVFSSIEQAKSTYGSTQSKVEFEFPLFLRSSFFLNIRFHTKSKLK